MLLWPLQIQSYFNLKVKICENPEPYGKFFVTLKILLHKVRSLSKILLSISILAVAQIAYAETTGKDEKKHAQPNLENQQTGKQDKSQEKLDEEPSVKREERSNQIDQDSLEEDSVNKYNFIFHFLYKFKYDHEEVL